MKEEVEKIIRLRPERPAGELEERFGLSSVAAKVLAARGFDADEKTASFINPTLREGLPHPDKLKNLSLAAKLLKEVVAQGGRVAVCSDFDVDGLSSAAELLQFLNDVGVEAKSFVPDRFKDGYGLNLDMVRQVADEGFTLLVALDIGTTNFAELKLAHELNLKTIVIDHHHLEGGVPECDILVNPEQEGCGFADCTLCTAGLVFYFIIALRSVLPKAKEIDIKRYLEFSALGTICDMVPLRGPNRVIAKRGLERMSLAEYPGLQALLNVSKAKKKVTAYDIGFGVGPRINAAGRIDNGATVVDLLTTKDVRFADSVASKLNRFNSERQEIEKRIKKEVFRRIDSMAQLPYGIVIADKDFHTGVIGIVAQRTVETYYRPTLIIGSDDGTFKGSGRGIEGFSVVEALSNVSKYLNHYGGHVGAGGFSVDEKNISALSVAFNEECERQLKGKPLNPFCDVDAVCELSDIDLKLVEELSSFAPFGMGNPTPTLLIKNLKVQEVRVLQSTHLKAIVSDGKRNLSALMWQRTSNPAIRSGATINLACRPTINSFNGMLEVQLQVQAAENA